MLIWCIITTIAFFFYSFKNKKDEKGHTTLFLITPDKILGIIIIWVLFSKLP